MRHLATVIVLAVIVAGAAITTSASAHRAPRPPETTPAPTVGVEPTTVAFKSGVLGTISICFGKASDEGEIEGYHLPVTLTVANTFTRPPGRKVTRTRRTHVFNLDQFGRSMRAESYKMVILSNCVQMKVVSPFLGTDKAAQVGRFKFRVASKGKFLSEATYAYTIKVQPGRRIEEGSDAFFNYCLYEADRIYSSGGKLYCYTETVETIMVTRVWK